MLEGIHQDIDRVFVVLGPAHEAIKPTSTKYLLYSLHLRATSDHGRVNTILVRSLRHPSEEVELDVLQAHELFAIDEPEQHLKCFAILLKRNYLAGIEGRTRRRKRVRFAVELRALDVETRPVGRNERDDAWRGLVADYITRSADVFEDKRGHVQREDVRGVGWASVVSADMVGGGKQQGDAGRLRDAGR